MAGAQGFRPTLLVGVGGTGSRIAQNVYQKAVESGARDEGRLRVLAFDTDENDNRRLTGLDDRQALQISSASTIDELLDRYPELEEKWFVTPRHDLPMELRQQTLLDGAGQVRMLSRLALHDAAANGQIENTIGAAISELSRFDNRAGYSGQVNVLMVGSLAGATGSGSFLQIAAIINDLGTKRNVETQVRGLFVMPDVYVRSGALPQGQIPSVLANGYASFKEFHAVTMKATDRGGRFDFEFEYTPGSFLKSGNIPFASLTIIDYEGMNGGNLGRSIEAYSKVTEQAAYAMLFTPIGGKVDSVVVNDVRSITSAAGRGTHNRIAAIGISSIRYPHNAIVSYLTNQMAREILSGDWLRLDEQFKDRLKSFRDQRATGNMSAVEPEQGPAYLADIKQLALDDQVPFFREIYDELNPVHRDEIEGESVTPLHETYLEEFSNHVMRGFWNTDDLEDLGNRPTSDPDQFADQTSIIDEVRLRENRLDDDFRRIEQALITRPNDIVVNLLSSADDMGENDWRAHHLQSYIIQNGPHLVRSRAFMFALKELLVARTPQLQSKEKRLQLYRLANRFDEDRGKEPDARSTPSILQQASDIAGQGTISKLFKGGKKDFVEDFVDYYNSSVRNMRQFAQARVLEKAYERLEQEVDEQIRVLNGLFQEIGSSLERLEREVADDEDKHARSQTGENTLYVSANKDCKKALWEDVQDAMAGQRLGPEANKSLMGAVFAMARRNRTARKPEGLDKLRGLFWDTVVDGFAKKRILEDYSNIHNFSVVEAIRREAEISDRDTKDLFGELVNIVDRQSQVMTTLTSPNDGQEINFWAYNEALREEMALIDDPDRLMNPSGQGTQTVEEPEFSIYELMSVSLRVNLELAHLAKLSPPYQQDGSIAPDKAGRYFAEYQNMVEELIDAAAEERPPHTITPHIHRDWHKPGMLPEISESVTKQLVANVNKAFTVSLAMDILDLDTSHGRRVAKINTEGKVRQGAVNVEIAQSHDLYTVLREFEKFPQAVRGCLEAWKTEQEKLASDVDRATGKKILGPELLRDILMMADTRRDEDMRDARVSDLVTGHCHLVTDFLNATRPELPSQEQLREADKLITDAGENALKMLETNVKKESHAVMKTRLTKGVENWRRDAEVS